MRRNMKAKYTAAKKIDSSAMGNAKAASKKTASKNSASKKAVSDRVGKGGGEKPRKRHRLPLTNFISSGLMMRSC